MDILKMLLGKMDVSEIVTKRQDRKPTLLENVMNKPEDFRLEAFIENETIIVKIMRREL